MTVRAIFNDKVIAESDDTVVVEGNHYFPPQSLRHEHFAESETESRCPWKGVASYYTVTVDGVSNPDAAWTYRDPKPRAHNIKDHVAFWRGVRVETDTDEPVSGH